MPAEAMERVSFLSGAIAACSPTCASSIQISERILLIVVHELKACQLKLKIEVEEVS